MTALGRMGLRFVASALVKNNRAPIVLGARTIMGKAQRGEVERPQSQIFPHEEKDFSLWAMVTDRCTTKMDENSRIILVDGAHAIGKTDLAKQLAEEFDMKVMPYPRMSDFYINYYGDDMNDYSVYMPDMMKPYDERDFSRNPTGPVEGCGDRYHFNVWLEKFNHYVYALKHLYSTGQGVVIEGNPWADYAHLEAAYNQRWMDRETRDAIKHSYHIGLCHLQRPHVLVYLDASVDTVMRNIKARGNPWDKDSPVWTNKRYLSDIYNEMKRRYLMDFQKYSHVLVYDWSTPGEMDIVVDDIEKLECDWTDEYDDLLRDWTRNRDEKHHNMKRELYGFQYQRMFLEQKIIETDKWMDCPNLLYKPEDMFHMVDVLRNIKSERYGPGYNPYMGDKNIMMKLSDFKPYEYTGRYFGASMRDLRSFGMADGGSFEMWPFTHKRDDWLEPVKIQK